MSGIKDTETIDQLRKRLYERGKKPEVQNRSELVEDPVEGVPKQFSAKKAGKKSGSAKAHAHTTPNVVAPLVQTSVPNSFDMAPRKKKMGYRLKILLAGGGFFVVAMAISSMLLLFGNNSISGENITLAVTGPFTIGGGERLDLQVGVTNDNAVPIEAATLIVNYPSGTKSASEDGKELFTERLGLDTIGTGETVNLPIRAIVFGEENEEKVIEVSIEYRVRGSNATFFKEAEPLRLKISSSPVIVRADTLKKISSGQETDVTLTVTSNAPTTLSEVLVKAEYPIGFDYTKSDPEPTGGQNIWLIKNLEPESSQTITITGVVIGKETDEYAINFTVGVPNERDNQNLASVFATTQTDFEIEQPFLGVVLLADDYIDSEVILAPGNDSRMSVVVTNTLSDTIYDTKVEVSLNGNAFSVLRTDPSGGFYDTNNKTIVWDVSNTPALESITPGKKVELSFSIEPNNEVSRTPQINIAVNVSARRVSENSVAESLTGTAAKVIKVSTIPTLRGEAGHNNGIFTDIGPVPPKANIETTYSLSLMIENGTNDIADAVITTTLPSHVTWLDETAGAGTFTYNKTNRVIEWNVGDVEANAATFASFQVSLLPQITQVGEKLTLMGEQRVRATDRFTGTIVRDTNSAITTQLSREAGFGEKSGVVQE